MRKSLQTNVIITVAHEHHSRTLMAHGGSYVGPTIYGRILLNKIREYWIIFTIKKKKYWINFTIKKKKVLDHFS